jgi:hypothetical protein
MREENTEEEGGSGEDGTTNMAPSDSEAGHE